MNIDHKAHERIDDLEKSVDALHRKHESLEQALSRNTELTQQIANNTSEIVDIVRGAKGLRNLFVWAAPVIAAYYAFVAFIKGQ